MTTKENKVSKAYNFAKKMHSGHVDKAGNDYFTAHILGVAAGLCVCDENTYIAALLHDVVEDTEASLSDVLRLFGGKVASIVATVTRPDHGSYTEYIASIKESGCPEAVAVKTADLKHNLSTPEAIPDSLVKKYKAALNTLEKKETASGGTMSDEDYHHAMEFNREMGGKYYTNRKENSMNIPFQPTKRYQLVINGCNGYPLIDKKEDARAYLARCHKNYPDLPAKIIEVNEVNINHYILTPNFDGGNLVD